MNSLDLGLALGLTAALTAWFLTRRQLRAVTRQRDIHARIATEKGRRLLVALDKRDAARRHADDVQWVVSAMVDDERQQAVMRRHPSSASARVLTVVDGGAS